MNTSIFSPLRIGAYRSLFFGILCADLGNWFDMIALNSLISFSWGMGLQANAALTIMMALPWLLLGPVSGVLVDRLPRKMVLITTVLLRMLVVIGYFYTTNFYLLLALVFVKNSFGSMFEPANQATIRALVPEELLAQASSLGQMVVNGTKIVGPTLGAMLVAVSRPQSAFLVEAVLFGLSAVMLAFLPSMAKASGVVQERSEGQISEQESVEDAALPAPSVQGKSSLLQELKTGLQHIRSKPMLAASISLMSMAMFLVFLYDGFFAPLTNTIGIGQVGYGVSISAVGIGSILGTVVLGSRTAWTKHPLRFMCGSAMILGLLLLVVGFGGYGFAYGSTVIWGLLFFVIGIVVAAAMVPFGYILQIETPHHLMGRVTSVSQAAQSFSTLLAPFLGAALGTWLGLGSVYWISGVAMVLLTGSFIVLERKKGMGPSAQAVEEASV